MNLIDTQLPAGWDWKRIIDMYRITKKPRTLILANYETIPFVPMEAVPTNGLLNIHYEMRHPSKIASGTYFERGDVLLSKITPSFENGKQGMAFNLPAEFGFGSTELIPLQPLSSDSLSLYLFYYLLHPEVRNILAGKMEGTTGRQRVPEHVVRDFPLPVPPLSEQQKIAVILWKIQQAIELQEKLIATTKELKQAAMRQLFTKGLHGKKQKQKETEIGSVPESWEVVGLESVLNKGMQNGAFIKRPNIGKGLHYVNVVDMYDEIYVNTEYLERIDVNKKDVEQYLLKNGDVLFVRSSLKREGIGQSCAIRKLEEEAFFDCHLIRISPDTAKILPEWLVYYWRSAPGKEELIRRSKTTTMTTINQQSLGEALLPLPSLGEQKAIIDILLTIDASIQFRKRKKQALSSLFQSTLHELMTGQIRVADLKIDISDVI